MNMDPLSIIASTIAIAGAVSTSIHQIKAFYDAGNELHALMNEVSELRIVLSEVESAIIERQSRKTLPQRSVDNICLLINGAKDKLQQLDTIIKGPLTKANSSSGDGKVARLAWLRQKSKAKRLQEELKKFRLSLSSVWGAANLYVYRVCLPRLSVPCDFNAFFHKAAFSKIARIVFLLCAVKLQLTSSEFFVDPISHTYNCNWTNSPLFTKLS
jgi:hypothetical protein